MEAIGAGKAQDRFLEDRLVGDERVELLGAGLVRNGPEACAGAAAHDNRVDRHSPVYLDSCMGC